MNTPRKRALSASELINPARRLEQLDLPEFDAPVYLRPLSAGVVIDFITEGASGISADGIPLPADPKKQSDAMLKLVKHTLADENGALLFTDNTSLDDIRQLPLAIFNALQERITNAIADNGKAGKEQAAEPPVPAPIVATSNFDSPIVSPSPSESGT